MWWGKKVGIITIVVLDDCCTLVAGVCWWHLRWMRAHLFRIKFQFPTGWEAPLPRWTARILSNWGSCRSNYTRNTFCCFIINDYAHWFRVNSLSTTESHWPSLQFKQDKTYHLYRNLSLSIDSYVGFISSPDIHVPI